jgi:hypothetical protein
VTLIPQITDQERLLRNFDLVFISNGPKDGMWWGHYLKCPICGYYASKGAGFDECPCGNIVVDSGMLRVSIEHSSESDVECYDTILRTSKKKKAKLT